MPGLPVPLLAPEAEVREPAPVAEGASAGESLEGTGRVRGGDETVPAARTGESSSAASDRDGRGGASSVEGAPDGASAEGDGS